MSLRKANRQVSLEEMPFRAWHSRPEVMPLAHAHTDIEFNLPLGGSLSYFFADRFVTVEAGQLAVFWAGVPHRLIALTPPDETQYLCMTLPLAWFLSWNIGGGALAERLLSGALFARDALLVERELFARWATDFASGALPPRVTLLEVEACLHRLAQESLPGGTPAPWPGANVATGAQAERIAAYVGSHYHDIELSVASIATAISLHPKYALALFKERAGMTLWEYVTRLRVSHAQRLLLTTDWSVERVALESGFASTSRFFAAFRQQTGGITPRQWRVQEARPLPRQRQ